MPEGDTIFRAAATLSKAIGGKIVRRFRSPLAAVAEPAARLEGHRIELVEARGKNLLIHFDDGSALHTHMRMTGSWHIYRPGEAWQKPPRAARAVLETDDFVAVCFNAPVVELIASGGLAHHPSLARLGPDILKDDFDADLARARLRERADVPISEALLMQGALAGIGNIYKSETLFLCRIDPFVPVRALSDETLARAIAVARELMSQNLDGRARMTTRFGPRGSLPPHGPRYHVYDRSGEPCLRCGTPIRANRAADPHRSVLPRAFPSASSASGGVATRVTYFCPSCQPPGALGAASEPGPPR
jgi:endonuclease-8